MSEADNNLNTDFDLSGSNSENYSADTTKQSADSAQCDTDNCESPLQNDAPQQGYEQPAPGDQYYQAPQTYDNGQYYSQNTDYNNNQYQNYGQNADYSNGQYQNYGQNAAYSNGQYQNQGQNAAYNNGQYQNYGQNAAYNNGQYQNYGQNAAYNNGQYGNYGQNAAYNNGQYQNYGQNAAYNNGQYGNYGQNTGYGSGPYYNPNYGQQPYANPQMPYQQAAPVQEPVTNVFYYILMALTAVSTIISIVFAINLLRDTFSSIDFDALVNQDFAAIYSSMMANISNSAGSSVAYSLFTYFLKFAILAVSIVDIVLVHKKGYPIVGLILFTIFFKPGYFLWRAYTVKQKKLIPILFTVSYVLIYVVYFFWCFSLGMRMMSMA